MNITELLEQTADWITRSDHQGTDYDKEGELLELELTKVIGEINRLREIECLYNEALAQEPVAAQHRFRPPQTNPRWSEWFHANVDPRRPAWRLDSRGWEVEYRHLYAAPVPQLPKFTLERDGVPSVYISKDRPPCCTHRMSEDDIPIWCKSADDAVAVMDIVWGGRLAPQAPAVPDNNQSIINNYQIDNTVPEGWQLAPKSPTKEMLNAAQNWQRNHYVHDNYTPMKLYIGTYQAMLAAAPKGGEE